VVARGIALLGVFLALAPAPAVAQRFGGDYGGAVGLWIVYADPGIDAADSFDRDLGGVAAVGGRLFFQTGRLRLGLGGFTGGFTGDGANEDGYQVQGGLTSGGFIAEFLIVQQNLEVAAGGMLGPGRLTLEEIVDPADDDGFEVLRRDRKTIAVAYPWARVGYNPMPFVNLGLEAGYMIGSEGVGGFAAGIEVLLGLIP
jgi:hypothetical protein